MADQKPAISPEAYGHLRDIIRYRLMAWDAATKAEALLDRDIDSSCESVDALMAGLYSPDDADGVSEEDLRVTFDLEPESA